MTDRNSITSFEDIADRFRDMPESTGNTSSSVDLATDSEEEVPDVLYILQCKEFGKGIVELRRGPKPIDPESENDSDEKAPKDKKKPVLEIVTVMSTSLVSNQPMPDNRHYPGRYYPGHPIPWGYGAPGIPKKEDESEMQISKSETTTMVIRSRHLINALAAVVNYYPGTSFTGDEVKIEAPYSVLTHHRTVLEKYKTSQPETHDEEYAHTTAKHIDILLGFLEETFGQQIREEDERHNRKTPTATYDWLWLLLRPAEVIYTRFDNAWAPFAISRVFKKVSNNADGMCIYSIDCWNYMYFEGKLRRKMHTFDIHPFSGEEAICNLPVIPARFFTGPDKDMVPSEAIAEQIRLGKIVVYDRYRMVRLPSSNWDKKARYEAIGKIRGAGYDDVFVVSSLFHHLCVLRVRVPNRLLEVLDGAEEQEAGEGEGEGQSWGKLEIWRSHWFDLFVVEQRLEAMRLLWGVMAWSMRTTTKDGDDEAMVGV
ncbi:hypothetical protein ONZ43_g3078 [Nemania bipapillata]|uniref:Uncharacterized protein n=1 Tax=Nemania bipapillata TaxID=110536 RepID=A0ACC2IY67_9PEZI|nr:hypothetical protein ONZ43_g3078 [Nemania bipapillata]